MPVPPAPGKATYKLHSGLATSKMRYFAPQQEVVVRGRVKAAVAGEVLTLYAIRGHKASKSVRRRVKAGGRFEFRFKVGGPGQLRLVDQAQATRPPAGVPHARQRRSPWSTGRPARASAA